MTYPPIIPLEGRIALTDILMDYIGFGHNNSLIHLFANDLTPSAATTLAQFVETTAPGTLGQPTPVPVFSGLDVFGRAVWTWPETIFTAIGGGLPQLAYGYWIDTTDPISLTTRLLWAQRFERPQVFVRIGQTVRFVITMGGTQC